MMKHTVRIEDFQRGGNLAVNGHGRMIAIEKDEIVPRFAGECIERKLVDERHEPVKPEPRQIAGRRERAVRRRRYWRRRRRYS